MVNSTGTKNAMPGDPVYLQTVFPIVAGGKVVIPPGSYITGAVTSVKRAGKVKGRSEIHLRFDTLMLPNGVIRDFRGSVAGLDSAANSSLDRTEGAIKGPSSLGNDVNTISRPAVTGTMVGGAIGGLAGATGGSGSDTSIQNSQANISRTINGIATGSGIGASAGLAVGIAAVLLTRGPDVVIERGASVEMVLDRAVTFEESELAARQ
jgi:type IV secretion system protein VirB10